MAGVYFCGNSGEVALAASTAKTVLQIKAAANQRTRIKKVRLMGKQAAGGTDAVVKIRMTRSSANFGTGTAVTFGKENTADGETLQTVGFSNFSVEPTSPSDSGKWWELQPQGAIIEFYPPGGEIYVAGGNAVNFEATSTGTPTIVVEVDCEE